MNLSFKTKDFELELTYSEGEQVETTLITLMTCLTGSTFIETYKQVSNYLEERKDAHKAKSDELERIRLERKAEKAKAKEIEAVNGVKTYENGKKAYKCSYFCTCGHKGVRYVHEDATSTYCHSCNSELTLTPSTLNEAHDQDFNYFLAM